MMGRDSPTTVAAVVGHDLEESAENTFDAAKLASRRLYADKTVTRHVTVCPNCLSHVALDPDGECRACGGPLTEFVGRREP
jgi:rRNA maturation endonuclease Nob1